MVKIHAVLLLVMLLAACRNEQPSQEQADEKLLTPEEVVRQFQAYYDNNQFEEAKALSTPRHQAILAGMADLIASEPQDSTLLHTEFLQLTCREVSDTAYCLCMLKDEFEEYETEFVLIKMGGKWLIDAPDEDPIEEEWMEELPDSLLEQ
ncbi:MAG: hypothetical protein HUU34_05805 [Saprospiraceae bacterium]|jgi:hypothetical protein|nr:hypothetical protein [Saprospiraceae bacterium]